MERKEDIGRMHTAGITIDFEYGELWRGLHRSNPLSFKRPYSFLVYKDRDVYMAEDWRGRIRFEDDDASEVISSCINILPDNGGKIFIRSSTYTITSTITISKPVVLEGELKSTRLEGSGSTDPVLRIESTSGIVLRDLTIDNRNGGGRGLSIYDTHFGSFENLVVKGKTYGLELINSWVNIFRACWFNDTTEYDGAVIKDRCNSVMFVKCQFNGNGRFGAFIFSGSAYTPVNQSLISFRSCDFELNKNHGVFVRCFDKGYIDDLLFDGCYFENNVEDPNDGYHVYLGVGSDTYYPRRVKIRKCRFSSTQTTGTFYHILVGHAEDVVIEDCTFIDTGTGDIVIGSGATRTTIIRPVFERSPYVISDSGVRTRIKGAQWENSGVAVFSGDGSTTEFKIEHGLVSTPSKYGVSPLTPDAHADKTITVDDTYIIITFSTAPPSGTDNLKFGWWAEV